MKLWVCVVLLVSAASVDGVSDEGPVPFLMLKKIPDRIPTAKDLSGWMLTFPEASDSSHVRLMPSQTQFSALSVCLRSFTDLRRDHALFSLASPSGTQGLRVSANATSVSVAVHGRAAAFGGLDYAPNTWHSVCTTWDSDSGLVQVWFNGRTLMRKYVSENPLTEPSIVVLGQELHVDGFDGFNGERSFVGMMTDVHMWNFALSSCEIHKFTTDGPSASGNVLDWAELDLAVAGRVLVENKRTHHDSDCDRLRA